MQLFSSLVAYAASLTLSLKKTVDDDPYFRTVRVGICKARKKAPGPVRCQIKVKKKKERKERATEIWLTELGRGQSFSLDRKKMKQNLAQQYKIAMQYDHSGLFRMLYLAIVIFINKNFPPRCRLTPSFKHPEYVTLHVGSLRSTESK